ncbi:MAG TPA: SpoIIE family protein phosphatase [Pyrinomonadaceae bacterium]|nr:SpoIIE family protein phosphatase [Pyrinomonadaceae bacterium]HMP66215.1 SpoIIE family protein phosphatase [Pyrinomonadaceae bacterium]
MARLIINTPNGLQESHDLSRLRTTIGRSARSDICIPDAFASRLHAEVRKEGDGYWLHDLGSANGTRYNGTPVRTAIPLASGGEIQIGETTLLFDGAEQGALPAATLIADRTEALDPSKTISFQSSRIPTTELLKGQFSSRNELLGLISKVGVALLSSTGLKETLDQVASLVFEAVPAERCVIMLRDEDAADEMRIMVARMRGQEGTIDEVRISHSVMAEVLRNGRSVLTANAQQDPRFATQTVMLQGIRSVLAVPLCVDERNVFGLIYADSPTYETTFTEEHLNILTTLASVAAIRVENATLLEERLERERMERELELATEIQQRFQPSGPPEIAGYEFLGVSFSCYEIGGDYYDFIGTNDGKMVAALGDVSGKGTGAALLMSSLHAAIHGQISAQNPLYETVRSVNRYLAENTPANRFVTLFIGELDPETGKMNYINAGHNPPLFARADGSVTSLESGGLPLGLMAAADYDLGTVDITPGDTLVVYSDGVTEATNPDDEEFGLDRLIEVVKSNLTASAAGLRDKVESALSGFTQNAPANDDITLLIVKRI